VLVSLGALEEPEEEAEEDGDAPKVLPLQGYLAHKK